MTKNPFSKLALREVSGVTLDNSVDAIGVAKGRASADTQPLVPADSGTVPDRLGHYQILGELGRGGMGVVYAAHDTRLDRKVAIKKLRAEDRSGQRRRLVREAMAMAKVSHPNVIPIYEIGERGDSTFIVMEYIEGATLRTWLDRPRSRAEILSVFKAAARGLSAAHNKGLIHRDFKPDNVMIGVDARVRVMDFGLARASSERVEYATSAESMRRVFVERKSAFDPLTQTGSLIGTPAYMSAEQLRGLQIGATSDQFSFCVALYEALYAERPFPCETIEELCSAVILGTVREAPIDTTVPVWLRALVVRGLRPEPEHRFESMQALLDALVAGELAHDADTREPPQYVFVAHHGTDKQMALRLCEGLLDHGVRPWFDAWDLPPGPTSRELLERALLEAPAVIVCEGSRDWEGDAHPYAEVLQARVEHDPNTVYRAILLGGSLGAQPVDERCKGVELDDDRWDDAVVELARLVGVDRERTDWLTDEALRVNLPEAELSPYRGLEAFHERDARWMFGREQETAELLEQIGAGETRFLTVIGASGSGKSSLLMAGVCPALRNGALGDGRHWEILYLRPGARPCESLAYALLALLPEAGAGVDAVRRVQQLRDELLSDDDALRTLISRINRVSRIEHGDDEHTPGRILLVVDQLEELFTEAGLRGIDEATEAIAFVRNLLEATRADQNLGVGLWVTATLRVDFVQRGLEVGPLAHALKGGTYFALPPMGERQIRAAVERPARRVGFRIETKLVDKLVVAAAERAGRLPLLQHVLRELWQRRDDDARVLTYAAYAETGGLEGAIAVAAERALEGLERELGERARLATRRLMTRLVHLGRGTAGDTRRMAHIDELGDDADTRHVLDAFVGGARVLVAGEREGVEVFELAHEALLREWTTLVRWLDADREALRLRQELAKSAGQRPGRSDREYLWGPGRVEEAKRVLAASTVELNAVENGFLDDSERGVRARSRRIRIAVVSLLVAALAVVLVVLQQDAEIRTKSEELSAQNTDLEDKERRQKQSLSVQRGLRAQMLIPENRESEALLLAIQAVGTHGPDWDPPPPREATRALGRVLADDAVIIDTHVALHGHENDVLALAYSATGERLATASKDGTIGLWNPRTGARLATMVGHEGHVLALAFSPEGERLATIGTDGSARVWDPGTGELLTTMASGERDGVAIVYSRDGTRLATANEDGRAYIWNSDTGERLATLEHGADVRDLAYAPNDARLATASDDGRARVWNPRTGELLATLEGHEGQVLALAYSLDGKRLATAGADNTARIWDPGTGKLLETLRGHDHEVVALAYAPDGTQLATASADNTARIWDANTGDPVALMEGHEDYVLALAYSPDGDRLATASFDRTARVWDARTGDHIATMAGHDNYVYDLAYSPDGAHLATASFDDTARVWDLYTYDPIATLEGHKGLVSALAYSPGGVQLATASFDDTARVWDSRTGRLVTTLVGHDNDVLALEYSPDGARLATASADKTARVWDPRTGELLATLVGHEYDIGALAFSPDGAQLATASFDKTARIWDPSTGELLVTLVGHEDDVRAVAYSPDGTRLATASFDNSARTWNPATGELLTTLMGHDNDVLALAYFADGTRLATASADKTARIWDPNTGELLAQLEGHEGYVVALAYCPESARLATASADKTARIWDPNTGELLATLPHDNFVYALTCSADGSQLATASTDKMARIWDPRTGELLTTLEGHDSELRDLTFAPNGARLATASADHTAKIWDSRTGELMIDFDDRVGLLQRDGSIDWPIPISTLLRVGCERLRPFADDYTQVEDICSPLLSDGPRPTSTLP